MRDIILYALVPAVALYALYPWASLIFKSLPRWQPGWTP